MSFRIVSDAAAIDHDRWADYVRNHPQGNVFQTPQMFSAYERTKHYQPVVVASFSGDDINGILLAVLQKEYEGPMGMISARSIVWGGPLTDSEEISGLLLSRFNEEIGKRAVYSQIRNFHGLNPSQKSVFVAKGFTYEPHLNILVDLPAAIEPLWKGIKRNRKDGINKAKKQGFVFEAADGPSYVETFYHLLEESYKSIKLPYPDKSFFTALCSEARDFTKWFVLKKDDVPIVVLAALIYKGTIHAFYIGTTKDNVILNLRPVDLFYYELMCWGIGNGFKRFDWMGAGKPDQEYGVRKFKLQYGGELIETGRFEKIHKPVILYLAKIGFWCWRRIRR
jgi:serine/alanine adding enzyme